MEHKVKDGKVVIEGVVYKAFEMFSGGPWKIVRGERFFDEEVVRNINATTANKAVKQWLAKGSV